MAMGLVPRRGALPPGGATRRATPCVLTITIETMPALAASSQYSPRRPMWLERISVPAATPLVRRFVDEPLGEAASLNAAKAPVAIGGQERIGFAQDRERRAADDFAFAELVEVLRNAHDAVRVVAAEVGGDERAADQLGIVAADAAGGEEVDREASEGVRGEGGHGGGFRVQGSERMTGRGVGIGGGLRTWRWRRHWKGLGCERPSGWEFATRVRDAGRGSTRASACRR